MTNKAWKLSVKAYGPTRPYILGAYFKYYCNSPNLSYFSLRIFLLAWEWELMLRKGRTTP